MTTFLEHPGLKAAGCWFLHSGIQEADGGVARYYRTDTRKNQAVSAEITGYALSAQVYLHSLTGESQYLDAAFHTARYLARSAWDSGSCTYPFEPAAHFAYFFDVGIIVRGLLAAARATGEAEFADRARQAALSLAFDFLGDGVFHPILSLPDKQPLAYEPRWSRQPGCYQLKSAMAWLGFEEASPLFESALEFSLRTHESFLEGEPNPEKLMDRLHAYCYFLEALLAVLARPEVQRAFEWGVARTAALLREIAPVFERSDVSAQLLRARLIAHHLHGLALDGNSAREEAERTASFQVLDGPAFDDVRLRGGFYFGRKGGAMLPFSNPVSTAFGLQALALWKQHQSGEWTFELAQLI